MADIFNEIDEELRQEKIHKLWDRYGVLVLVAAVVVVVAVAGWRGWDHWRGEQAKLQGNAGGRGVRCGWAVGGLARVRAGADLQDKLQSNAGGWRGWLPGWLGACASRHQNERAGQLCAS